MDVTNNNFEEVLPEVEKVIDECTFMAIDCEFSGLKENDDKENYFETVEERYEEVLKKSAGKFFVVQFGLCAFFHDEKTNEYTHKAYNFYTFPRCFDRDAPNLRLLCESSSLDFLASTGFDFNKWIYQGIPYLTFEQEQKMIDNMNKRIAFESIAESSPIPVPEYQKKFIVDFENKVKEFINSPLKEIEHDNLRPFQKKLIFNNIRPKYRNLYFETIPKHSDKSQDSDSDKDSSNSSPLASQSSNGQTYSSSPSNNNNQKKNAKVDNISSDSKVRVLRISKLNQEEQDLKSEAKKQNHLETIKKGIGFSKVIRKISQSKKLVVGHNMLLDVSHTIHHFVTTLPGKLEEFKHIVRATFNNLIDTKLMAYTHPFKELIPSSVLFDLCRTLKNKPFCIPKLIKADEHSYDLDETKRHVAGFDAFVTGVCFIGMCQYLGSTRIPEKMVSPNSPIVLPFSNKLFMMKMLDISYLNISGTDLTPSRDHVFFVTCPTTTSTKHVDNLFKDYGGVQTFWMTETSLFVSLNDKSQSEMVVRTLIPVKNDVKIITFKQFSLLKAKKQIRDGRSKVLRSPVVCVSCGAKDQEDVLNTSSTREVSSSPPNESQTPKRPKKDVIGRKSVGQPQDVVFPTAEWT